MTVSGSVGLGKWARILAGVVLVATLARVWLFPGPWTPDAAAQIPNAGAQRAELMQEAQRTNELLGQILETLRTKTIRVKVTEENQKTPPPKPTSGS